MAIYEGGDLSALLDAPHTADARRHYHSVDISESIWNRMQELGINQTQLAGCKSRVIPIRHLAWRTTLYLAGSRLALGVLFRHQTESSAL